MQIVIDIPNEDYNEIQFHKAEEFSGDFIQEVFDKISNGSPLPKGHGRLIDADKLLIDIERKNPVWWNDQGQRKAYARLVYYWAVKEAETIIMPERSEKEE